MAKKVLLRLRLATEIDMLGADPPLVNGPDGPRAMNIGDLLSIVIPTCPVGGVEVWQKVALKRAFDGAKEVEGKKKRMSLPIATKTKAPNDRPTSLRTVGGLIVSIIPSCASRDDLNAARLWRIGGDISEADGETFTLTKPDFDALKSAMGVERESEDAERLSDIADDIKDSKKPTIDLPSLDFDLLRKRCKEGNRPTWVVINLNQAFDAAKEVGKDDK